MKHLSICLSFLVFFAITEGVVAQENKPVIVPERVQTLAAQYPIAERMGITWDKATIEDTGRYLGLLAGINEAAKAIAIKNDRNEPSENDFKAAFATWCIWPTNKPPMVQDYWKSVAPAFYDEKLRAKIQAAVGPTAWDIPKLLDKGVSEAEIVEQFPITDTEYFSSVINLKDLVGNQ